MNWTNFQTYNTAADKAFEMLCNQLFENWCKMEYASSVVSFSVVNGAGGDGGVESYAVLNDGSMIGLQAKWFPGSLTNSQVGQIRNSIKTALKVRPQIARYIVSIPRDLASKTARSENTEDTRWNDLVNEVNQDYPLVTIELWNNSRIVTELQKASSAGIYRFWFKNAETSEASIKYAFDKAKSSWLNTKYIPELNTYGGMSKTVSIFLGQPGQRAILVEAFSKILYLCEQYQLAADALLLVCTNGDTELKDILISTSKRLDVIYYIGQKIKDWLLHESSFDDEIELDNISIDFESLIGQIHRSHSSYNHHFHSTEVTKILRKLSKFNFQELFQNVIDGRKEKSILFLGDPGTGKTHGVGAISEKILDENLHIPLVIRARNTQYEYTWKDIISEYLGLSSEWSEEELWQALSSMANRHRFTDAYINNEVSVSPKVIIFVDGIDESFPQRRWVERIEETEVIVARYPRIRFCFTARPTSMPKPINYARAIRISSSGDVPVYKLFDSYMRAYNISAPNRGWLRSALTTPLALKLFCELNRNQTVTYSNRAEVSMSALWRIKIGRIEQEYCEKTQVSPQNQHILKIIVRLSELFVSHSSLERSRLIEKLANVVAVSEEQAEKLLSCLEEYGVLSSYCEVGTGILPDIYYYYPGMQGYFDYAAATILLDQYKHPQNIDFNTCKEISSDALNGLAVLSIQNYDYLLTRNETINVVLDDWNKPDLQFFALQHTNHENALQFVERSLEIMGDCANGLITIANRLVLPLSRDTDHPLGVLLLDSFLQRFDTPAQRDILWSIPGYLKNGHDKRWSQNELFDLGTEEYLLSEYDFYDGCPTVYAWALSSVNNPFRKLCRDRLMVWAKLVPEEFYKLFVKFSAVNDPQIKSDLFSILMCLTHEGAKPELIQTASQWVMENVLSPDKIDCNRDVSIRYYSVAIVYKAVLTGLIAEEDAAPYLPPYHAKENRVSLSKDALQGTRMGGYSAIDYDLARYVLIDHFHSGFKSDLHKADGQLDKLINAIASKQPDFNGITFNQLILSMAYAYILEMGWNEEEFYNFDKSETGDDIIGGVDISISRTYSSSTHGAMSPVMTVCEKYVWQARNVISGFLCDRLLFGDDAVEITDYGMLDDFVVPSHELCEIDPDDISEDSPWHIPEQEIAILDGKNECREDVVANVLHAPLINWEKWIYVENSDGKYRVCGQSLIALNMYSCFYGSAGVASNLFISAVLIKSKEVAAFVETLAQEGLKYDHIANPTDWFEGTNAFCYITPKEICCFPWKSRYKSTNFENFPQFEISAAVDKCCYNYPEYGDVYYNLPSISVRQLLGIVDSDGYKFTDSNQQIKAEYTIAGEKWRTYQSYLLADKDTLFRHLEQSKQTLVWVMRERRSNSGMAIEKYGAFGIDRTKSFVGYFDGERFITKEIRSEIMSNLPRSDSLGNHFS